MVHLQDEFESDAAGIYRRSVMEMSVITDYKKSNRIKQGAGIKMETEKQCFKCKIKNIPLFQGIDGHYRCADCAGMIFPRKAKQHRKEEQNGN